METTNKQFIDEELGKFTWFTSKETRHAITQLSHERGDAVLKLYTREDGGLEIPDDNVATVRESIRNVIRQAAKELTEVLSFDN